MMHSKQTGFTLIELMIVVAIIAIIASIAVPNLLAARSNANESAAVATLKNIGTAQQQCKTSTVIDVNLNGNGEYGWCAELAGGAGVRSDESGGTGSERISPPYLSGAFSAVTNSVVRRSGYFFGIMLPSSPNLWTWENSSGGGSGVTTAAAHAEAHWGCYAWPVAYGASGKRVYYTNEKGDILTSNNSGQKYSGTTKMPQGYAAVHHAVTALSMASTLATNTTGLGFGLVFAILVALWLWMERLRVSATVATSTRRGPASSSPAA